jgi:single-stranded DNA-binding protein
MGSSLNVSVVGFVGSDPQVRTVQTSNGEQQVASFSVAISRKNGGGQKQTLWVRVNCWGNLSNVAQQYVRKGSLVQATTEWMRPSAWISQDCEFQRNLRIARDSNIT